MTELSLREEIEIEEIRARINKMMAETEKLTQESRWYLLVVGAALFAAAAAFTKLLF